MTKFLELIAQRRVWASVAGIIVFLLHILKISTDIDVQTLTDLATNLGIAFGSLASAVLAVWSYLKPKVKKQEPQEQPQ